MEVGILKGNIWQQLFLALGLIILLVGCAPQEKLSKAPSFTVKVMGRGNQSLSDFKGPLILHFWAPYCPPCKKEMLEFQEWYEERSDKPSLLAIAVMDSQQSVEKFVRKRSITFPVGMDEDGKIMRRFKLSGALPATVSQVSKSWDKNEPLLLICLSGM